MLAGFDPPEEPDFVESVRVEVTQELRKLQGRPSLAIVCGSSEMQQQAAMFGLSRDRYHSPLLEETIPALVQDALPGMPYVVSSPTGGELPFEPGEGVAHYFGVGAYLRPAGTLDRRTELRERQRRRSSSDLEGRRRQGQRHLMGLRGRP
jgi:beta-mannosidase